MCRTIFARKQGTPRPLRKLTTFIAILGTRMALRANLSLACARRRACGGRALRPRAPTYVTYNAHGVRPRSSSAGDGFLRSRRPHHRSCHTTPTPAPTPPHPDIPTPQPRATPTRATPPQPDPTRSTPLRRFRASVYRDARREHVHERERAATLTWISPATQSPELNTATAAYSCQLVVLDVHVQVLRGGKRAVAERG